MKTLKHVRCIVSAWIFMLCAFAPSAAQPLTGGEADSITIVFNRVAQSGEWGYRVWIAGDSVTAGPIEGVPMTVRLAKKASYYVACYRRDPGMSKGLYINPVVAGSNTITITCSDSMIYSSDQRTNDYGARFEKFNNDMHFLMQSATVSSLERGKLLDSNLLLLERDLRTMLFLVNGSNYVSTRVIQPVRTYFQGIVDRWAVLTQESKSTSYAPGASDSRSTFSEGSERTSEAHQIMGGLAHDFAMRAPRWIRDITRDTSNKKLTLSRKVTVDQARLTSYLLGAECACEVSYGLFRTASARLGEDYKSCEDSLAQFIRELASRGTKWQCRTALRELDYNCMVLATKNITSLSGLDRSNVQIERTLSKDTVYVLHFWGMWCKPCLDQHEEIMLVADTLQKIGATMIHVAGDNPPKFDRWQKFVAKERGEHFFTSRSDARSSIGERLAVSSYPSYVILGRNGVIVGRPDSYADLVKAVKLVQAQ